MSFAAHPVGLNFKRLEDYATQRAHASYLRELAGIGRREASAYESYRSYCKLLGQTPLDFENWRGHQRKLFGPSVLGERLSLE